MTFNTKVTTVKLAKLRDDAVIPMRATPGSFGYDLSLVDPMILPAGGRVLLPSGLRLASPLPPGIAMLVWPRSSTFLKYGIMVGNSIGLIDADYSGEIKVLAWNTTDQTVELPAGIKVAQLVFPRLELPFVQEAAVNTSMAERGGFGSTGA